MMKTFLLMCFEFFKTGLFAVGGGLATIPFLKEMSVKYGWFTLSDITTMVAVSESTPGPIGINMATYIGNKMFGFVGGIAATLSLVAPSIIVICIIARMLEKFKDSKAVKAVFTGLRPAVAGFILSAVIGIYLMALCNVDLFKETGSIVDLFRFKAIVFFAALLALYKWKPKIHPILIIAVSAIFGIFIGF